MPRLLCPVSYLQLPQSNHADNDGRVRNAVFLIPELTGYELYILIYQ